MRVSRIASKAIISILLLVAVTAVFTLSSFAAQNIDDGRPAQEFAASLVPEPMTGNLVVMKGNIRINGNDSQTGATILSGSRIVTGSDGLAVIDLGSEGRVEIRDDTTVTVTFAPGLVHIKTECDRTRVEVTRGVVDVKSPETKAILAGKDEAYDGSVEATTNGGTDFILDCGTRRPAFILAGWWGFAGLVGAGAAIFTGIIVGGPDGGPRGRVSPVFP